MGLTMAYQLHVSISNPTASCDSREWVIVWLLLNVGYASVDNGLARQSHMLMTYDIQHNDSHACKAVAKRNFAQIARIRLAQLPRKETSHALPECNDARTCHPPLRASLPLHLSASPPCPKHRLQRIAKQVFTISERTSIGSIPADFEIGLPPSPQPVLHPSFHYPQPSPLIPTRTKQA